MEEKFLVKKKVKKMDVLVMSYVGGLSLKIVECFINEEYDMVL